MSIEQEVKLKVRGILGVNHPFWQGGSLRLTIPKGAVRRYGLEEKIKREEYFAPIFLDTDRGILLLPFDKAVNPINVRTGVCSCGKNSW